MKNNYFKFILLLILNINNFSKAIPLLNNNDQDIYFCLIFFHKYKEAFIGKPIMIRKGEMINISDDYLNDPGLSVPKEIHDFAGIKNFFDYFLIATDIDTINELSEIFKAEDFSLFNFSQAYFKFKVNCGHKFNLYNAWGSEDSLQERKNFFAEGLFCAEKNEDKLILQKCVGDKNKYYYFREQGLKDFSEIVVMNAVNFVSEDGTLTKL